MAFRMGYAPPGICCKLYAFLNLVEFSSIAVCSSNLIIRGRSPTGSSQQIHWWHFVLHFGSMTLDIFLCLITTARLKLRQSRLTMTATKSFPRSYFKKTTMKKIRSFNPSFVSTSCENGKKAPVFIRKFNLSPQMYRFPWQYWICIIAILIIESSVSMLPQYSGIKISNLTLVFATLQLRILKISATRHHSLWLCLHPGFLWVHQSVWIIECVSACAFAGGGGEGGRTRSWSLRQHQSKEVEV